MLLLVVLMFLLIFLLLLLFLLGLLVILLWLSGSSRGILAWYSGIRQKCQAHKQHCYHSSSDMAHLCFSFLPPDSQGQPEESAGTQMRVDGKVMQGRVRQSLRAVPAGLIAS